MDFRFATCVALFWLLAAARCAPTPGPQDACADVRNSSLELNHIAKNVSVAARNGSKDRSEFATSLVWMEAQDMCDPETLKQKPALCVGKILDVLTGYEAAVEMVSEFESCSELAKKVKPALKKLHEAITKCVKLEAGMEHHKESNTIEKETEPIEMWKKAPLCLYTMDRLFSFSILTARVFAVGDPAHHAEGSTQKCM